MIRMRSYSGVAALRPTPVYILHPNTVRIAMKTKLFPLLIAASCLVAVGCQSDAANTAHEGETTEVHTNETHAHDGPAVKTVTGRLSGFDCAVVGELCPTTHRGGDYTTGVFTDDGSFYFVVNIPQSFLTQYFRETVEVEGSVYEPYGYAVEPEAIHLLEDGDRRLVYEAGYFIDDEGNRATFHDGRFQNGRWVVP